MADPTVDSKAKEMGWSPREEWRGDPDKWVDAETFVRRGEEVLPLVKAQNKKLQTALAETQGQVAELKALLNNSQEAIEALQEHQSETTRAAVERAKGELRAQLRQAREAGDEALEEALQDKLDDIRDTEREIKSKVANKPAPTQAPVAAPKLDPEFITWQADNDWYGVDERRTALMLVEAKALRSDPANANLRGYRFYEKAAANVEATLNPRSTLSKVEGGRGGSDGGSGSGSSGKSYADLPKEAKGVCDDRAAKLVGPGRVFKKVEDWRAAYARDYFGQE